MGGSGSRSVLFAKDRTKTNILLPSRTGLKAGVGELSPEKVASLCALGQDPEIGYRVALGSIYSETDRYLDTLARQVHEGKAVDEAANFARWLRFSGVLTLLEKFSAPGQEFPSLQRRLTDLLDECGEHFRGGRVAPKYATSDIEEIKRDLAEIRAALARPVSKTTVVTVVERSVADVAQVQLCKVGAVR